MPSPPLANTRGEIARPNRGQACQASGGPSRRNDALSHFLRALNALIQSQTERKKHNEAGTDQNLPGIVAHSVGPLVFRTSIPCLGVTLSQPENASQKARGIPQFRGVRTCAAHEFIFELSRGDTALSRSTEGAMARHFGVKPMTKIVKKPKESPKIPSPASWRGKPERRTASTR